MKTSMWIFLVLLLVAGTSGCGQTQIRGELIYEFAWAPGDGANPTMGPAPGAKTLSDFYEESGEDDCNPANVERADLEIDGGIKSFGALEVRATAPIAHTPGWDGTGELPQLQVDPNTVIQTPRAGTDEAALHVEGLDADGPGTFRVTVDVETMCGVVWK